MDPDLLLDRLDAAIGLAYATWEADLSRVEIKGDFGQLINPPRDRTSYLLDGELPIALSRNDEGNDPATKELRDLARALDADAYIWLLLVYADSKGDQEGVRRAWDVAANPRSPYRQMFKSFRERSEGGKMRSGTTPTRNARIRAEALDLKNAGKHQSSIAGVLAKKHDLSQRRIRQILKENGNT